MRRQFKSLQRALNSRMFSNLTKGQGSTLVKNEHLQFSKSILTDFGDLELGNIPESLRYIREHERSRLQNGIQVNSEKMNSELVSINVSIRAGSRNETLENSGVSQFVKTLILRGTSSKSRTQIEDELQSLGGNLECKVDREYSQFTITVQKDKYVHGLDFLLDLLSNSTFTQQQIESEKQNLQLEAFNLCRDQYSQLIDSAHATSYRDHQMGQPLLGIRDNIQNINAEMVHEYVKQNIVGSKIVVSVAGGQVDHKRVEELVEKRLGKLKENSGSLDVNTDQCEFTASTMYMRDDEMNNINVGVFFKAPSYNSNEHFQLKLLQRIMGEYQADKYTGRWLNSPDRQYSTMHSQLGQFPDITLHKCDYFTYSDTALFGSYLMGNEVFVDQLRYMSQFVLTEFTNHLSQAELTRAKNLYYNQLLINQTNSKHVSQSIGLQSLYFNRRVSATEEAYRIAAVDPQLLQRTISKFFWDRDLTMTCWGPVGHALGGSTYRREVQRSSLGWHGAAAYSVM